MSFLLLKWSLANLGVGEDTDDSAVLLDTLQLAGDGLAGLLCVLLGIFREGLLLRLVPILVEASLDFVAQMLGPNGSERSEAARGFNVSNKTNDHHLRTSVTTKNLESKAVQVEFQ